MRLITRISLVLIFALFVSGCQTRTFGHERLDDIGKYMQLRENESTKSDVYETFGQPHDVRFDPVHDVTWVYYKIDMRMSGWTLVPFVGMAAGGHNVDTTFAYFAFDSSNTLRKTETRSDSGYQNQWASIGRGLARISDKTQEQRVEEEMKANGFPFDPELAKKARDIRDE